MSSKQEVIKPSAEVVAALETSVALYKEANDKLSRSSKVWHKEAVYWSKEASTWRVLAALFAVLFIVSFIFNIAG